MSHLFLLFYLLKKPSQPPVEVPSLNFAEGILTVQLNILLFPLHFLQIAARSRDFIRFSPFGKTVRVIQCSSVSFYDVSSHWNMMPISVHSLGVIKGWCSNCITLVSFNSWNTFMKWYFPSSVTGYCSYSLHRKVRTKKRYSSKEETTVTLLIPNKREYGQNI